MIKEIKSATNPFIKQLRALASSKKARQESGTFIIEGWRGIKTLLEHTSPLYKLEQLVISDQWSQIEDLPKSIDIIRLPKHLFEKISDVRNAQGILGLIRPIPAELALPQTGKYLLLDNLRDPGNLGTLIRSAIGSGFDGVLLYGDCVDPFNPKVIRSTMGTFAFCHMQHVNNEQITELLNTGFDLCVTTGVGGQNLYKTTFSNKTILVIGSEAHGVGEHLMNLASKKITIPLQVECESLNAAIAGSVCMFQIANTEE